MKDLKLSLIVQAFDKATAPLRGVANGLKGLEERAEKLRGAFSSLKLGGILGGGLVIGAAVEAGHGIFELTDKVAEMGEGFLHAAQKAGTSVEAIQRLGFAVKQLGGDQDALGLTLFRFETHLANGARGNKLVLKSLGELGIGMADLSKLTADPVEAFLRLSDGLRKLPNAAQRARVTMDLFGRSGATMIPVLMAGREELSKFMGQLDAAHAVMSGEDAEASEKFIQQKNLMGLALKGLEMRIGVRLLPVMGKLVGKLIDVIDKLRPGVIDKFADSLGKLIDQLPALIDVFSQLLTIVAWVLPKFTGLTEKVGGLKTVLSVLIGLAALEFFANLVTLVGALAGVFGALRAAAAFSAIIGFFEMVPGFVTVLGSLVAGFLGLDAAMWANPVGIIILGVTALIALIVAIATHWKQTQKFFADGCMAIGGFFDGLWKRITKGMPEWLKTGIKIGSIAIMAPLNPVGAAMAAQTAFRPSASAAGAKAPGAPGAHRTDVHIHVTADGQAQVKKVTGAASTSVSVNRGRLPG